MSSTDQSTEKATVISRGDHFVTITKSSGRHSVIHRKGRGFDTKILARATARRFDKAVQIAFQFLGDNLVVADQSEVPA